MRLAQLTLCLLGLIGFTFAKTHTWYYKTGWVEANPDGMYTRQVIGWNGTWPLPNLRVKKGDTVNLYLTNGLMTATPRCISTGFSSTDRVRWMGPKW